VANELGETSDFMFFSSLINSLLCNVLAFKHGHVGDEQFQEEKHN